MINDTNQTTYQANDIVSYYAQLSQLQPAEATILNLFEEQLSSMKMLDIGVGGGRTTKYFGSLVKQYIGIDYSAEMIAVCQQKFSHDSSILLEVVDARDLRRFNDNYFDFILFSFNGIDYLSHVDRLQVFQEISRVGKPGGYFFFSTHNLQGIEREFNWRKHLNINPMLTYVNLVMFAFLRFFNRPLTYQKLQNSPYAIIRDESHNFRLKTYYIRPIEQIQQLQETFTDIQVYSWKTGQEITNKQDLCANIDMWLYYLCLIK